MFLVHFVGDMHQPLHCSDNKDKGGNDVKLDFFGRTSNLHSVWDSGLLGRMGQEDALFAQFSKDLTEKRARKWGKGTVYTWAEQSHKAAQKVVYGKLPKSGRWRAGESGRGVRAPGGSGDQGPDRKGGRAAGDGVEHDAAVGRSWSSPRTFSVW